LSTTDWFFSHAIWRRRFTGGLFDIEKYLGAQILGDHLLWKDGINDPLISFTTSPRFAVQHAALRDAKGAESIYLHWIDTHAASNVDGTRTPFHDAVELCSFFDVNHFNWPGTMLGSHLHPRKYNHE